ncbi:NAD(P)-dependent oxidoreductase [Archangium violaceum]|uniref:NAD-dependent epimerase/dehydratase family protein n=1 Tax=Archangium violaceum TaxID=83451 RepID=UPI00194E18AE|nr:NAD(P)-dependent oxidoreductase [Archangium violaceum]QRO01595.1 NAD(P)-dependent oxidoreductase [Archangium violaceum]
MTKPWNSYGAATVPPPRKLLVTGSSGQLGAEICRQLSLEYEVTGLDVVPGPFTQVVGSMEERTRVFDLVARVDAVIHAASLHAPHRAHLPKSRFIDVNVQGTLHLLEAAVEHGCKRFVYTSTTSVYGRAMEPRGDAAVWVTEELTPEPRDIYDVTKLAAEQLCRLIHEETGLPVIILRTSRFFPQSQETLAIHRLNRGLDVRDCVWAHRLALESHIPFGLYNISARPPFHREDMAELLRDAPGVIRHRAPEVVRELERCGIPLPPSMDRVYVIERAESELGFHPRFNALEFLQGE